jgi:hypothetical protein
LRIGGRLATGDARAKAGKKLGKNGRVGIDLPKGGARTRLHRGRPLVYRFGAKRVHRAISVDDVVDELEEETELAGERSIPTLTVAPFDSSHVKTTARRGDE